MSQSLKETQLSLAVQAIRTNPKLSLRKAAFIYSVPRSSISLRMAGITPKAGSHHVNAKLTATEAEVIIQYILDLDSRGFSPTKAEVEDMANLLLAKRDAPPVGKCWTDRFISRQPRLSTRLNRAYDYQRALQEDPDVLNTWFQLARNMRVKYGVPDCDFYNFDETGFMMGQIKPGMVVTRSDRIGRPKAIQPGTREWATAICCAAADGYVLPPFLCVQGRYHLAPWYHNGHIPSDWVVKPTKNEWTDNETGLEWLKHFDRHTRGRKKGVWRMLVLDGHESHVNAEFQEYCKENNIITLCLPPHSSHLTQPLDIGLFAVLKVIYGAEISNLIKMHITHITKDDFFPAFKAAFLKAFTPENVAGGFRGSGLQPFDPEKVLSKLDVRLHSPARPATPVGPTAPWVSQTPSNAKEAISQSELIKTRVIRHQSSSPTTILDSIDKLTKAIVSNSHQMTLMDDRIQSLEQANEVLSRRRRAKRTRLQDAGVLTGQDAANLLAERGVVEEERRDEGENGRSPKRRRSGGRLCGICRKPGHNARTCPDAEDIDRESDSDCIECI